MSDNDNVVGFDPNRNYLVIRTDYQRAIVVPATSRNLEAFNALFKSGTTFEVSSSYDGSPLKLKPKEKLRYQADAEIYPGTHLNLVDPVVEAPVIQAEAAE